MSRTEQIFFEVFEALPRQGPGNLACVQRALSACSDLPAAPQVLDLGCGAGAQTLHLASLLQGSILAIDQHPPLIERLKERIEDQGLGLGRRVEARVGDMCNLGLPDESFDLVWSEGALYNLGLDTALPLCFRLLRPGGYLAFTEAVYATPSPSDEVREAFADYPTMGSVEDVILRLTGTGASVVEHFDLPPEAWWDDFYGPMEQRIAELRETYRGDAEALAALDDIAREPDLHRRLGHEYGYTFFIARKT